MSNIYYRYPKGTLEDDWKEEALRHRKEITQKDNEIERLNNIINDIRKDIEVIEQIDSIDTIKMNLRNIVFKVKEIDNNVK